jgi:hypothetical protein
MALASEDDHPQHFNKLADDAALEVFFPSETSLDIAKHLKNSSARERLLPDRHNAFFGQW